MPFLKSKWQMAVNEIAGYEKDRHSIKKFLNKNEASSRLGTVFAASGFREVSSTDDPNVLSLRDWALVRISPTRSVGNNRVTVSPALHQTGFIVFNPASLRSNQTARTKGPCCLTISSLIFPSSGSSYSK